MLEKASLMTGFEPRISGVGIASGRNDSLDAHRFAAYSVQFYEVKQVSIFAPYEIK